MTTIDIHAKIVGGYSDAQELSNSIEFDEIGATLVEEIDDIGYNSQE